MLCCGDVGRGGGRVGVGVRVHNAVLDGLAVFDVSRELSLFGQWALLLLIQVGGLGIMTLSTLVYTWIGRRMSLRHELAVEALLGPEGRGALRMATGRIVGFALIAGCTTTVIALIDAKSSRPATRSSSSATRGAPAGSRRWPSSSSAAT